MAERTSERGFDFCFVATVDFEDEVGFEMVVERGVSSRGRPSRSLGDGGEDFVGDFDGFRGVEGLVFGVGDDGGDDVTDMVHFVAGEGGAGGRRSSGGRR